MKSLIIRLLFLVLTYNETDSMDITYKHIFKVLTPDSTYIDFRAIDISEFNRIIKNYSYSISKEYKISAFFEIPVYIFNNGYHIVYYEGHKLAYVYFSEAELLQSQRGKYYFDSYFNIFKGKIYCCFDLGPIYSDSKFIRDYTIEMKKNHAPKHNMFAYSNLSGNICFRMQRTENLYDAIWYENFDHFKYWYDKTMW